MKITRGGRLSGDLTGDVARLTSSSAHDQYIADDVIEINLAHLLALLKAGLVTNAEAKALASALSDMLGKVSSVPPDMEDVHMVIEEELIRRVGPEVGGKIHTGKSRNDQVATALRMRLRRFLIEICGELAALQAALIDRAEAEASTLMPGFTHFQHAQPVTVGHYLLAHSEMHSRNMSRLLECLRRANHSPMGSAALAGTGFRIDRSIIAEYLGFDGVLENTIDAVSSRDFALEAASALSIMMLDLGRMMEEIIVWSSLEYGYVEVPDDHSSTSSIMPQKKNAVTAEMIRAKAGEAVGSFNSIAMIMKGLPLAYNLDMQDATPPLWRACESAALSLRVAADLVRKLKFNSQRLAKAVKEDFSVATELADLLVREGALPFRTSHRIVGSIVRDLISASTTLSETPPEKICEMIEEKAGVRIPPASVAAAVDPAKNVAAKPTMGGPALEEIARMAREQRDAISSALSGLDSLKRRVAEKRSLLRSALSSL